MRTFLTRNFGKNYEYYVFILLLYLKLEDFIKGDMKNHGTGINNQEKFVEKYRYFVNILNVFCTMSGMFGARKAVTWSCSIKNNSYKTF